MADNVVENVTETVEASESTTKTTGKVKWFNLEKGYGYVTLADGTDVFIGVRNIENGRTYTGFDSGDEIEFDIKQGKKGPMAVGVNLLGPAERVRKPRPNTYKKSESTNEG